LYIRKNIVEGAVIAEEITDANRAVPPKNEMEPFCCTEESFPAKCGINRIWTCEQRRRNGIASLLVDQVRLVYHFFFVFFFPLDIFLDFLPIVFFLRLSLTFTVDGKVFAEKFNFFSLILSNKFFILSLCYFFCRAFSSRIPS